MVGVFLNVKKAFGTTWHSGILHKLSEVEFLTRFIKLTASLLTEKIEHIGRRWIFYIRKYSGRGASRYSWNNDTTNVQTPPSSMRRPHLETCITKRKQKTCSSILMRLESGTTVLGKASSNLINLLIVYQLSYRNFRPFRKKHQWEWGPVLKTWRPQYMLVKKKLKPRWQLT
jgi:hypothetical protein